MNENDIVNEFENFLRNELNEIILDKPSKEDYKDYKFDLILKKEGKVLALIEAKYRSDDDRPTTDALIASFWKMLWEWGEKYCFSSKVKLVFIIFIENGKNINVSNFRNSIFNKFKCFGKKFCNRDIPLYVFSIRLAGLEKNSIEFNDEDVEKFVNFIQNIEESKNG